MKKISVVSVVHNEENYIEECYTRLKPYVDDFVVIDQESTDNTINIAKKFTNKVFEFPRVYYPYAFIHEACLMANNNLVLKADPDEWWDIPFLQKLQDIITTNEADIYFFKMQTNKGYSLHPRIFKKDKILWTDSLDASYISLTEPTIYKYDNDIAIFHQKDLLLSVSRYRKIAAERLIVRYADTKIPFYENLCLYCKEIVNGLKEY